MNCPCQSGLSYEQCCGRFISQQAVAENAQQLMRSRYTAFALGNADYLKSTWHADHRPSSLSLEQNPKWIRLDIKQFEASEDRAMVWFEAWFLDHGRLDSIHEKSRFVYQQGCWWYTEGEVMASSRKAGKPARNEPCPCGSGKKFKRCCAG